MSNYIINSKQIILEKNKESVFKIPVLFSPIDCEFHVEMNLSNINDRPIISFILKGLKSNSLHQISFQIEGIYTIQNLFNLNNELTDNYLLLGCVSSQSTNFSLSIKRNKSQTY